MKKADGLTLILAAGLKAHAEKLFLCGYISALTIGNMLSKGKKRASIYRKAAFIAAHRVIKMHTTPRITATLTSEGYYNILSGLDLINKHASSSQNHTGRYLSQWIIDSIQRRTGYTIHIIGA
jgi:hypothetical protein